MKQYLELLDKVLYHGIKSEDRTGTGTLSLFSETLKMDLKEGFPLLTTKFVNYEAVLNELLWFIGGHTNITTLNSKIWDQWATMDGDIGPMYGAQWRNWEGQKHESGLNFSIDQLAHTIENIKNRPYSRRHVISAWNPAYLPNEQMNPRINVLEGNMALAPCHHFYQFYVRNGELNLHFSMRSTDVFLGLPFNIASYATLLIMVANLTGLKPRMLSYHGVDVHLYKNHIEQAKEQLSRTPYDLPHLHICTSEDIDSYTRDMFTIMDYQYHDKIYGAISV